MFTYTVERCFPEPAATTMAADVGSQHADNIEGRCQVKKCGMDTPGERAERDIDPGKEVRSKAFVRQILLHSPYFANSQKTITFTHPPE